MHGQRKFSISASPCPNPLLFGTIPNVAAECRQEGKNGTARGFQRMSQEVNRIQWDTTVNVGWLAAVVVQSMLFIGGCVWIASKYDSRLMVLEEWKVQQAKAAENRESRIQALERDVPVIREKVGNVENTTGRIENKIDAALRK